MNIHSKGPFSLKTDCGQLEIYAADGYSVAAIPIDETHGRPGEDSANARLFAAAPEMLDALKDVAYRIAKRLPQDLVGVATVISKAEKAS